VPVPVFREGVQVGRASSSAWSPTLERMIALATVTRDSAQPGTALQIEMTVDHRRKEVGTTFAKLPFFDPPRKRSYAKQGPARWGRVDSWGWTGLSGP